MAMCAHACARCGSTKVCCQVLPAGGMMGCPFAHDGDFGTSRFKGSCAHDTPLAVRTEEGKAGKQSLLESRTVVGFKLRVSSMGRPGCGWNSVWRRDKSVRALVARQSIVRIAR
jgi:hypothetical protein